MGVIDINNHRSKRLIEDLQMLVSKLFVETNMSIKNHIFNDIQEKLEYLEESLLKMRK